jgi:hypothetical protein
MMHTPDVRRTSPQSFSVKSRPASPRRVHCQKSAQPPPLSGRLTPLTIAGARASLLSEAAPPAEWHECGTAPQSEFAALSA